MVKGDREPVVHDEPHTLMQPEPGSRDDGTNLNVDNVLVPIKKVAEAILHLEKCKISLHPDCFQSQHDEKGPHFVPTRQHAI